MVYKKKDRFNLKDIAATESRFKCRDATLNIQIVCPLNTQETEEFLPKENRQKKMGQFTLKSKLLEPDEMPRSHFSLQITTWRVTIIHSSYLYIP